MKRNKNGKDGAEVQSKPAAELHPFSLDAMRLGPGRTPRSTWSSHKHR